VPTLYFVVPWYPERPTGGAESLARHTVQEMRRSGVDARVLTTCVPTFRDDHGVNVLPAGAAVVDGVPVERFPVDRRDWRLFDQVNLRVLRGEPITDVEGEVLQQEGIRSRALEARLRDLPTDAVVVYMPYLFGTTYWGMAARPGWLWPCLHDEPYARLPPARRAFAAAQGILCNAPVERDLVVELYGVAAERVFMVGAALPTDAGPGSADRFHKRTGVEGPFLVYVGRKDEGKGVGALMRDFALAAQRRRDVRLVLIGPGSMPFPPTRPGAIVDLGFVDEETKRNAFAAGVALCAPSRTESFSIVLMESWLAGRPGLVNAHCAVTREHVVSASGGLAYDGPEEFGACLDWLIEHPDKAARMGRNGGEYVRRNFTWDIVVARLRRALGV
jgi:glycosyltransferase involved in cell wall biosynthesis